LEIARCVCETSEFAEEGLATFHVNFSVFRCETSEFAEDVFVKLQNLLRRV